MGGRLPVGQFTGSTGGAPLTFITNARNFAGRDLLAFLETVWTSGTLFQSLTEPARRPGPTVSDTADTPKRRAPIGPTRRGT